MGKPKAKSLGKEPRRKRLGHGRIKTGAQIRAELLVEQKAAERR
jgi:hypothetical protein